MGKFIITFIIIFCVAQFILYKKGLQEFNIYLFKQRNLEELTIKQENVNGKFASFCSLMILIWFISLISTSVFEKDGEMIIDILSGIFICLMIIMFFATKQLAYYVYYSIPIIIGISIISYNDMFPVYNVDQKLLMYILISGALSIILTYFMNIGHIKYIDKYAVLPLILSALLLPIMIDNTPNIVYSQAYSFLINHGVKMNSTLSKELKIELSPYTMELVKFIKYSLYLLIIDQISVKVRIRLYDSRIKKENRI